MDLEQIKIQLNVVSSEMDKLSEWEAQFIESISDQFTNQNSLSEKQLNILNKIYSKVV